MAEADPGNRNFSAIGFANEILERRDEGMIFIGAVPRPGDQPGIGVVNVLGKLVVHHGPGLEGETVAGKQPLEHGRVFAVFCDDFFRYMAGLQDTDFHD